MLSVLYFCSVMIRRNIDPLHPSGGYTVKWLVSESECKEGFEGLSKSHLFCLFCLSGISTYLFTATCCALQDARSRAPDWHFGGGMGCEAHYIKLISWRLWCCTQLGLLYTITNTANSRLILNLKLTEKYESKCLCYNTDTTKGHTHLQACHYDELRCSKVKSY